MIDLREKMTHRFCWRILDDVNSVSSDLLAVLLLEELGLSGQREFVRVENGAVVTLDVEVAAREVVL
jgi:hypothetical protein